MYIGIYEVWKPYHVLIDAYDLEQAYNSAFIADMIIIGLISRGSYGDNRAT